MATKIRLDTYMHELGLVSSRSQAENLIRLGKVICDNQRAQKPGQMVQSDAQVTIIDRQYVSRAAYKLDSVANIFKLSFKNKVVLDVGSSTGGFTDYALQHGAKKIIAVDVGTNQLHPTLRDNERIILVEQTDIRELKALPLVADMVVIDVSFISLRDVLPHIKTLVDHKCDIVAMLKPQFEAGSSAKHKGVIKNARMRRDILQDFESWARQYFMVVQKADSAVEGAKGNLERFYLLKVL